MEKYIHLKKEDREFIAKAFGITERTIYNATHFADFNEGNELAKKIRKLAISKGGIIMNTLPELETLHDADGYMRQYLPNGVLLEFCYAKNDCVVFHKGAQVKRYEKVYVSEIPSIQDWAATLK